MSALEHNPPTILPICNQPKIYFAYGSNLHLRQMANRCPESKLLGIGRLWGHRWQINERGYANVVEHIASHVDGICYLLNETDEARLDINEGVGVGAYEKQILELEVLRRPAALVGRDVVQIVNDGCLDQERSTADGSDYGLPRKSFKLSSSTQDSASDFSKGGEFVEALVYVSTRFTKDYYPREEYIGRMNSGLNDAILMGISSDYVDSIIKQYLTPGVTKYLE